MYLGLAGEMEISEVTDSTLVGGFYATLIKPEIHIPPHMVMINNGGFVFSTTSLPVLTVKSKPKVPEKLVLFPAYPNPFNPTTTIKFSLMDNQNNLHLSIYDIRGRLVENIHSGSMNYGYHTFKWDASRFSSGIYFVHMVAGENILTKKITLLK